MPHIYLASPHMSDEGYEQQFVKQAFDTNWVAPLGANVDGLEHDLCAYTGAKAAAALSAGTAALHLALLTYGIGSGDIVLCQSLTFAASANPVVYCGATPVFIDSEPDTWNISPDALRKAFEKYPDAKAVIAVHLYGTAYKSDEINEIAHSHGAYVIEDAAEALGSTYKGRKCGTLGDASVISFNGNKIITTSGGGMLLFSGDDAEQKAAHARFLATQARDPAPFYQHTVIGYNYRMSNITAGIGRGQMKVLEKRIGQKQHIFEKYAYAFRMHPEISMMPKPDFQCSNDWLACITVNKPYLNQKIYEDLKDADIETRPIWKPMHLQPVYKDADYIDNGGVSEKIFKAGLCLPTDTKMDDRTVEYIIDRVITSIENE